MSYKIALDAGHGLYTAGKRCDKTLDPYETREWVLNNRIAVLVEEGLKEYTGYELIRTDDRTGKTDVSRPERCKRANKFKADIFISLHANAAEKKFSGGGIVTYVCKGLSENGTTRTMQKDLYNRLIQHTGLKGNRAKPLGQYNYDVLVLTEMPAILCELGFMNSTVDTPIILTDEFAKQASYAIIEFLAEQGKLRKKNQTADNGESQITVADKEDGKSILKVLRYLIKLIINWAKG